jgi:hypothetical protein
VLLVLAQQEDVMRNAIIGALAASTAMAASASIPPAYLKDLPPEQHQGLVDYITGGKNAAEAESVKRAAQEFPLELVFVEKDGARKRQIYDNPVVIRDALGGVVFAGRTDGPYFLAKLPIGQYTVTTHWDSWSFTKPVTIDGDPGDRQRVVFEWDKPATKAGDVANG